MNILCTAAGFVVRNNFFVMQPGVCSGLGVGGYPGFLEWDIPGGEGVGIFSAIFHHYFCSFSLSIFKNTGIM